MFRVIVKTILFLATAQLNAQTKKDVVTKKMFYSTTNFTVCTFFSLVAIFTK